jgi:hypothetical protein
MNNSITQKRLVQAFITLAIATTIIFFVNILFSNDTLLQREIQFEIGEIAPRTIIAPFTFPIYEDEETLKRKQDLAEQSILPRYTVSQDALFQTQKRLDNFFLLVEQLVSQNISENIANTRLRQAGYSVSPSSYQLLKENSEIVYERIQNSLHTIFAKGLINKPPQKEKIILIDADGEHKVPSSDLLTKAEAKQLVIDNNQDIIQNKNWRTLFEEILDIILVENVIYDEQKTQQAISQARASVPAITGEVLENELIVQEHQKITEDIYIKLKALNRAQHQDTESFVPHILLLITQFLYIFLVLSLFIIFFYYLHPEILNSAALFRTFVGFTLVLAILLILAQNIEGISVYLVPFGLPIILLAFLVGAPASLTFGVINLLLFAGPLNLDFSTSFIIGCSGMAALIALPHPRERRDFYHAAFYIIIFLAGLTLILGGLNQQRILDIITNLGWGVGGAVLSLLGSMALLAPIERHLPVITDLHLLELGDFSRMPLSNYAEVASGSYHHSIVVGNLAEVAAKAIGANHVLARVGSYYHDISKMKNPEFFIENIKDQQNIHDEMDPEQSAKIIKHHVEDGVKLAEEYNLPKAIIDIIQQHHGTSQISYFYQKAVQLGKKFDESNFYYDGPKPQTKEAAIVMIADVVESATKSLDNPRAEEISSTVDKAIKKLIETDQLSESGISLKELKLIKEAMMPVLLGIYQKRIAYPEEKPDRGNTSK